MNIHKNARATPHSRLLMVRRVIDAKQPRRKVAADFGVSVETVGKWVRRWRAGGEPALNDRSSAPAHPPHRLPPERVAEIERLRRQRMSSPAIARQLGIPISTVTSVLRRLGLNRLKALEPPQPILRYERERPGELLHLDTKKLGRIGGLGHRITGRRTGVINRHLGIGWEYLHVCVDDASRLASTEILADERKESAVAFLGRALVWFACYGVSVERVMTDNGNCYRSHLFRQACNDAGIRHLRTSPIRHVPMARPSASFKPSCENAPTPAPSTRHRNEQTRCRGGRTPTTSIGRTPHSPASPQSPGSTRTTFLLTTASALRHHRRRKGLRHGEDGLQPLYRLDVG